MFFLIVITKNFNADEILILNFVNVSNFDWKSNVFEIKLLAKSLSTFVIIDGVTLNSSEFKYLTKQHLNHSLSSVF